ncbi:hypothetical protein LVD15_23360 [Fulvivirga maritima]|uniref:hypothetical protein n=1 Tax=Fulvivirga maritima TaxID=2904247 RepID=UPI001F2E80EA|nr:hypothetical protein [Fulvivirga maritima]UII26206.1 hypothetical protein LVD15_23360 [Fulvivirga maritima]
MRYFIWKDNDVITRKGFTRYLFNKSNFNVNLTCYEDLIGLTTDGATFDFYEYEIGGLDELSLKENYPKYEKVFNTNQLTNMDFSYWKHTPIPKERGAYHFDIAYSSNLSNSFCSSEFQRNDLMSQSGNYYSYISAYPIGVYLFIYSPFEETLYVIFKK